MNTQAITASTGARACLGLAVPAVQLVNCRHGFGEALKFDAVVDGVYPDRRFCLWLSQPAETYKGVELRSPCAYVAIPSLDCASAVVDSLTPYHLCSVFRKGESITVQVCGEGAPDTVWEIAA